MLVKLFEYLSFNFKITSHPFIFGKGQTLFLRLQTMLHLTRSVFLKLIWVRKPVPAPQKAPLPHSGITFLRRRQHSLLHLYTVSWACGSSLPTASFGSHGAWVLFSVFPRRPRKAPHAPSGYSEHSTFLFLTPWRLHAQTPAVSLSVTA